MSGTPSWARTAPSSKPTMEWTMLWGWTTTWICSGATSNSHFASMISRALLNMDAESTVIFWPMFQVGWFRASALEAFMIRSFGQVRKGPPEAVRKMRAGFCPFRPSRHWKMALCSLSTGSRVGTPFSTGHSFITSSPPATRVSLLARRILLPARRAAIVTSSPATPTMDTITSSAPHSAAMRVSSSGR